jgi:rSAM/selenodomain-associated transferase 2
MRISVVVPTLTEAATVAEAVGVARRTLGDCELIVVDGGSADGTAEAAEAAGATVLQATGSRAEAMNAGAARASGDALLFLHADTILPEGAGDAIRAALAHAEGGAFRLGFDERPPLWRVLSAGYARTSRTAYGDQAIFVSRTAFDRLGGYRQLPIMEDYDLVERLRRQGRFELLPLSVRVSARRHRRQGELRTFLRIGAIKILYRLGVPPDRLARAYPSVR